MKQTSEHLKGDHGKGHQGHSASPRKDKEQQSAKGNSQEPQKNEDMEKGNKK